MFPYYMVFCHLRAAFYSNGLHWILLVVVLFGAGYWAGSE